MQFLTVRQVVYIHDELVRAFGGVFGVRDESALDSALLRPQMGNRESLAEAAALLVQALIENRPFLDGNKRTATASAEIFLKLNGHYLSCDDFEAYEFFMELFAEEPLRFAHLLAWLDEHIKPLRSI